MRDITPSRILRGGQSRYLSCNHPRLSKKHDVETCLFKPNGSGAASARDKLTELRFGGAAQVGFSPVHMLIHTHIRA